MSTVAVGSGGFQGPELVLEGVAGAAMGSRFAIPPGSVTIGRGDKAKIMIVRDTKLSSVHFEIAFVKGQWSLKDLESSNGTHVNARRVGQSPLNNGDLITAGESAFRVRIQIPEDWSDITPAEKALLALLYGSGERVYALLDAAREDRLPAFLEACDTDHRSLFAGAPRGRDLKSVAPYLAVVPNQSKILKILVREGWGQHWGVYLTSAAGLEDLARHLERFLVATAPNGQQYYYRFWDPRVLRPALGSLGTGDRQRFFGPVGRFVMEDQNPSAAMEFRNTMEVSHYRQVTLGEFPNR